jgi:hypothetical protein
MKRVAATGLVLCGALLGAGCATLDVQQVPVSEDVGDAKKLPGLPFYSKRVATFHETTWVGVDYEVSLAYSLTVIGTEAKAPPPRVLGTVSVAGPALDVVATDLRRAVERVNGKTAIDLGRILSELRGALDAARAVASVENGKYLQAVPGYGLLPTESALRLTSNRAVVESVLDGGQRYYINGRRPLLGVGKADFTLNADQTLTAVKAEADSKTLETVLGVIPVKDYLSKSLKLVKPEKKDDVEATTELGNALQSFGMSDGVLKLPDIYRRTERGESVATLDVALTIEPKVRQYKLRREQQLSAPLSLATVADGTSFYIEDVDSAASTNQKENSAQKPRAFEFSGRIVPPGEAP